MEEDFLEKYISLMEEARDRIPPKGYTERHHIVPRSWWDNDYLVVLTAEEHFIAHYYLTNAFPEDDSMAYALWAMCNGMTTGGRDYKVDAKIFAEAREKYSKLSSKSLKKKYKEGNLRIPTAKEKSRKEKYKWFHNNPGFNENLILENNPMTSYELFEFCRNSHLDVDRRALRRVVTGKRFSCKGWRILKERAREDCPNCRKSFELRGFKLHTIKCRHKEQQDE